MKLLLYPHGGSGNHGCEAIVRSTLKMIPTATLFSSNPDEDKRYGLDAICTLRAAQAPMSHLSLAYLVQYGEGIVLLGLLPGYYHQCQ